ncbi:hypothetical protein [Dermatobacter hominis]|uniref:hypothetical protein n=1 Tax=Dermatobacter hominis TaxID=2884263 RepID=UPI001D11C5BE|nr:hypothetical protein [Dermatobacter hominis]UDY34494.1 hypothetical protein LH044_14250 [Dermatobacter hominis]
MSDPPEASLRNEALQRLEPLLGRWALTLHGAWFLESPDAEVPGRATIEWLDDAFVTMRTELGGDPTWDLVFGRSDANDTYTALYHDERGVCRVFGMAFDGRTWTMERQDPDFHQRFVAEVEGDRIDGRWDASDDRGATWRTDFLLRFDRTG